MFLVLILLEDVALTLTKLTKLINRFDKLGYDAEYSVQYDGETRSGKGGL